MSLGYLFSPTTDQASQAAAGTVSPPQFGQQSLQTLSFRLPRITGAATADAMVGGGAPSGGVPGGFSPLLGDRPSAQGSTFSSAVLQSVLRTILGSGDTSA